MFLRLSKSFYIVLLFVCIVKDAFIEQVPADKPKAKKEKGPNKEEVLKKFSSLLDDLWKGSIDLKAATETYKELKIPDKFCKDAIVSGLNTALNRTGKSN